MFASVLNLFFDTNEYIRVMHKRLYMILFATAVVLAGCRDLSTGLEDDQQSDIRIESIMPDHQVEIGFGETVTLEGTDLEISFSSVTGDNRCPSDVLCIIAGAASILLSVTDSTGTNQQIVASIPGLVLTPHRSRNINEYRDWTFRLLRLNPYPVSTVRTPTEEYRALIIVESVLQ